MWLNDPMSPREILSTSYDLTTAFEAIVCEVENGDIGMREALDRLAGLRSEAETIGLEFDLITYESRLRERVGLAPRTDHHDGI